MVHQLSQQHHPAEPIQRPPLRSKLQHSKLPARARRRNPPKRHTADLLRRILRRQSHFVRRLLLRPLRRRRHHPRLTQQRVQARPFHQSASTHRPQRLRRLPLHQPERNNHRASNDRPPNSLAFRETVILRPLVSALPSRRFQQHALPTRRNLRRFHHSLSHRTFNSIPPNSLDQKPAN